MSDDELAFLRAAAARPDDDLPRLVYADWLDEQGTAAAARAAFIRLQVRRSQLAPGNPERDALLAEEAALLRRHVRRWNAPSHRRLHAAGLHNEVASRRALIRGWSYHRGMVGRVTADGQLLATTPEVVFELGAVAAVRVLNWASWLNSPRAGEFLRSLRAVQLVGGLGLTLFPAPPDSKPHPSARVSVLDLRGVPLGVHAPRVLGLCRDRLISPVVLLRQCEQGEHGDTVRVMDPHDQWAALRPWYEDLTSEEIDARPYPISLAVRMWQAVRQPTPPPVQAPRSQTPVPILPPPVPSPSAPASLPARVWRAVRRFGRP